MASDWVPIVSAACGAVIALTGSLLTGVRADRSQRSRDRESERLSTYAEFAVALDAAHAALREVARSDPADEDRYTRAVAAVHDSKTYSIRERLLMSGSPELVRSGEEAFLRLVAIRNAVRTGARLSTSEFHDVYHPFAEALWTFRIAVRRELGQESFAPDDLGRVSWSEQETCPRCGVPATAGNDEVRTKPD
ncbi:hypothetical protein JIG36_24645 [Actinoplanes sp. LDG1-06]|uniref:Secreted protein n=1 Tax=Paractinoplanes ovalisporus TaxID=2810368 RepID=A0ABS2AG07_9ACTN|nr:hypothetical protein [Actinoplanes ovalisporus]MBM2618751.1 hypothetical protein [Actinoplanes ovalisporus]